MRGHPPNLTLRQVLRFIHKNRITIFDGALVELRLLLDNVVHVFSGIRLAGLRIDFELIPESSRTHTEKLGSRLGGIFIKPFLTFVIKACGVVHFKGSRVVLRGLVLQEAHHGLGDPERPLTPNLELSVVHTSLEQKLVDIVPKQLERQTLKIALVNPVDHLDTEEFARETVEGLDMDSAGVFLPQRLREPRLRVLLLFPRERDVHDHRVAELQEPLRDCLHRGSLSRTSSRGHSDELAIHVSPSSGDIIGRLGEIHDGALLPGQHPAARSRPQTRGLGHRRVGHASATRGP